jgi:Fe-S oxidoreductase
MVGEENYELFRKIKLSWDPYSIFNPGKIIDSVPMTESLRFLVDQKEKTIPTMFSFGEVGGILSATEKCNGSGDCRKSETASGGMCPSYQATKNEKDTTRARANILREFLTRSAKNNPFDYPEIKEVMDLCISCKACSSECPSNVDMSTLKAEFLFQYYKNHQFPIRSYVFSYINSLNKIGSVLPSLYNYILTQKYISSINKSFLGIHPKRSLPKINNISLHQWYLKNIKNIKKNQYIKTVYLFCDEFTNYNDAALGIKGIKLLDALGYEVKLIKHEESGRAAISKGLLNKAKTHAQKNVELFSTIISEKSPLIGIEPSGILSFRDEYPKLTNTKTTNTAKELAKHCFLIDEFIANEIRNGHIRSSFFHEEEKSIVFHGHCHQKSLSNQEDSMWLMSLPVNYHVEIIPSGCCGMAGSFGYEKEHYEVSQKIGELVLFPYLRKISSDTIIAATGTSCRHQITDGVQKKSFHPIEILYEALL